MSKTYSTFSCEKPWGGQASASNSLTACLTNVTHLATLFATPAERAEIGGVLIPLALALLTVLWYPMFLALRYCVDFCGSYKRRPGYLCTGGEEWDEIDEETKDRYYDLTERSNSTCVRAMAYISLLVCFVPMVLLLVGTGDMQEGYDTVFSEIYEIVTWAEEKQATITANVKSGGATVAPLNATFFEDVERAVSGYRADIVKANQANEKFVDVIKTVAIVFALLPGTSIFATTMFAAFDIRSTWPLVNSFFHFIFVIMYSVIASGCLLIGVLTTRICGERDAYLDGNDGILKLWVQPKCEAISALSAPKSALNQAKEATAVSACANFQTYCDAGSTTYSAGDVIFYCNGLTAPGTQCRTSTQVYNFVYAADAKTLTGGGAATCSAAQCTIHACQTGCDTANHKNLAVSVVTGYTKANNMNTAYNTYNDELGNCGALLKRSMQGFKSCDKIRSSVFFIGVGSTMYVGLFIIGFYTLFRGMKRFYKPTPDLDAGDEFDDAPKSPGMKSPGIKSPTIKSFEPIG